MPVDVILKSELLQSLRAARLAAGVESMSLARAESMFLTTIDPQGGLDPDYNTLNLCWKMYRCGFTRALHTIAAAHDVDLDDSPPDHNP